MASTLNRISTGSTTGLIAAALLAGCIAILSTVYPSTVAAATSPKIIVLPFEINAPDNLSYLHNQISTVLAQQLEKNGSQILSPTDSETDELVSLLSTDLVKLRETARTMGADHIIWGSFTLIDNNFSLDVRLATTDEKSPVDQLFIQGKDIETLLGTTQKLAAEISRKLFPKELIAEIQVKGNKRIESDAILRMVSTHVGDTYQPAQLSKDLKAIYQMGYFDDIRIEAESEPRGKIITIHVTEKPTIRNIKISGNSYIDEDKIRENLTISTGSILNLFKVRKNMDQIKQLYLDKNYYNATVDYKTHLVGNNQADLEFIIKEGAKLYVTDIEFEGNQAFTSKKLRKTIKTKKKGFFFWLTESGDLKREQLDQDTALLTNLYQNNGYINVRIGEPQIDIKEKEIHIKFKIEEGHQFHVRQIDTSGDLILPKEELLNKLSIKSGALLDRETIRNDVLMLSDIYANKGYAHAEVIPHFSPDPKTNQVDLMFTIHQNQLVSFEYINIKGNTRTRDKVIRRELEVYEQEKFNNQGLKRSYRNLYRLDFFDNIKFDTPKGSADDKMDLNIEVVEKGTGSFNFGGGYSGEEYGFIFLSVSEKNLFGRGQTVELGGQFGSSTTRYQLSFAEPWLFDIPLYSKVNVYDQDKSYDDQDYTRNSNGAGLKLGYRILKDTNFYGGYSFDNSSIAIDYTANPNNTPQTIKDLEGTHITSSVEFSLVYDTRNHLYVATEGMKQNISFEYAGLGGDIGFNKVIAQSQIYFPLFKGLIGFLHGKVGYVYSNDPNKILPDYEKFYMGGVGSLRGFKWHGVSSTEIDENNVEQKVGGNTMVQFNAEVIFPLVPSAGVNGLLFYDTGNVYEGDIDLSSLRKSAGIGIRWLSPIAPIEIVYGWLLDQRDGEEPGRLEFSFGTGF